MNKSFSEVKRAGIRPFSEVVTFTRQITVVQCLQAPDTHSDTGFSGQAASIKNKENNFKEKKKKRQKQADQYLHLVDET